MKILTYEMCLQYINAENEMQLHEDNAEYHYNEKLDNTHDKIFRDLLSDEEEATKFINKFYRSKRQLKKEDLEKYSSSYITKEYKNRESDIVYKIKNTNTFILIEHQSYVDKAMPYRMLEYSVEIMRSAMNKEKPKGSIYPEVVLIVLYTGSEKWNIETEYKKITDKGFNYETNGTNSIYNLIDIHNYRKEDLIKGESVIEKAMAIEKCGTQEELIETLEQIINDTKEETRAKEKICRIIQYILSPIIGQEQAEILLKKLKKEEIVMAGMLETNLRKERMKLIAESERRGEERGIKVGEKRGIERGIIKVAKEMLKEKMSTEKIMKITKLKEDEIEKIKAELASA